MKRDKCIPANSRDVQKVLIVLQCQKVFAVVEFEQKLMERWATRVTSSTWCLLWLLLRCEEVYEQPGQDACSALKDAGCICIKSCYMLHTRLVHTDAY